jgi:CxxC-x17-CxxC domain-containing protein
MVFQDKTLQCADCGEEFTFTGDEQRYFQSKGFTNEPKRCPSCRRARKAQSPTGMGGGYTRQMFPAVCDECGKETEVPFKPSENRPVYCRDCYNKIKLNR